MKSITDGWKYQADWIDELHLSEATILEPDPEELRKEGREEDREEDAPPYRDSVGNYWHDRMVEKYGPFMWAVGM